MDRAIVWSARARKDMIRLERPVKARVTAAVERLSEGEGDVRHLAGIDPPLYRLRVGDWRVLFRADHEAIYILRVQPPDKA